MDQIENYPLLEKRSDDSKKTLIGKNTLTRDRFTLM